MLLLLVLNSLIIYNMSKNLFYFLIDILFGIIIYTIVYFISKKFVEY